MKNIPGPAGFHAPADSQKAVSTYSVALERKRTIISYFCLECCWIQLCKDLGVDISGCSSPYSEVLYSSESNFQDFLQRWTDALVRSEVLLSAVPMSPGPLSTATSGTELALAVPLQRRHATLGELRTGTFDFCAPRLAVVVDSVVTTCTGDVILKLVDTTGSSVAFTAGTAPDRAVEAFADEASQLHPSQLKENALMKLWRQMHPGTALLLQNVSVYVHRDATAAGRWSRYLCITLERNVVAIYN